MFIPSLGYCGARLDAYALTQDQYNYLLPAKRLCNLLLYASGDRFAFIGTTDQWRDVQQRLEGLQHA